MAHARRRRFAVAVGILGLAAVASLAGLGSAPGLDGVARAAGAATSPVTISVRLDARGRGTFTLRGGLADGGRATARRAVVNRRLNATVTLHGAKGRIVLTSQQRCGSGTGTWRVLSGTSGYDRLRGRGTATGRALCTRPLGPSTVVYRGAVELPPAALAAPGPYGGSTAEDSAVLFDVTADGRAIANLLLGSYRYECVRSDGLRSRAETGLDVSYAGPFPIAEDRTFTLKVGFATIGGRFTASGAQGTITIDYALPADAQGRTSRCSASIAWTVTTPPPPPKRALAGTYCGISPAGEGACLDVLDGGRTVRNFRIGVTVRCGDTEFTFRITYDETLPLQTNLAFRITYTQPLLDGSARAFLSGTFDQAGAMSGMLTLQQPSFTHEGVRQTCRNGGASFTARLQR